MRYRDGRRSLCVSSQSGCPLTCTFCATGRMAFGRNLTASEILDQALHFRRIEPVNHAVFMGMGEPMMNLDAVLEACEHLPGIGIATSHTTVSTVGWVPGIKRMATEGPTVRLALSVHSAEPGLRSELMPVNDRYPLHEVIEACREWRRARRRKVYIEYLMLAGVNDSPEQAQVLAAALEPHSDFKVNLIPYNPTGALRRLDPGADRRLRGRPAVLGTADDGAPHPRPRHRRGVRPARGDAGGRRLARRVVARRRAARVPPSCRCPWSARRRPWAPRSPARTPRPAGGRRAAAGRSATPPRSRRT